MLISHKAIAEIIGTFTMISVGGGSILLCEKFPQIFHPFIIPITWGLIIAVMIFAMGHISGAHFNPAVTLAFAVTKRIPSTQVPLYWMSQCVGGLGAALLLIMLRRL